jgi:hypothetical protein
MFVATSLMLASMAILLGYALYAMWSSAQFPWQLELAIGLALASCALFGFYALRSRARGLTRDPYEEIEQ